MKMPRPNTSGYSIDPFLRPKQQVEPHHQRLIEKLFHEVENRDPPPIAGRWWWIARDFPVGRPVGYCSLTPSEGNMCVLSGAGVRELHRGKGLHRRMIGARHRCAASLGYEFCMTEVDSSNVQAINNFFASRYRLRRGGNRLLLYRRL